MNKLRSIIDGRTGLVIGTLGASLSVPAHAAAVLDVTAATAEIAGAGTAISTVGVAIIGLAALAMTIRWVKATFF